jgi:hypothetical protein
MVLYLCVLIVFSLHRESLKLILVTDPFRGGSITVTDHTDRQLFFCINHNFGGGWEKHPLLGGEMD